MKTKNAAFSRFLDTKYIPLESKFKVILLVLLFALPLIAFFFLFLQPNLKQINQLQAQETSLEQELATVKKRAQDLPQLEAELAQAQIEFEQKATLLPKEKEIPQLLRDISARGRNAGLDFLKFKPEQSTPRDFYAEIPVSINVRGPYHNVGYFFDLVSKLDRIVSVSNIRMTNPKIEGGEMLLNSTCQLLTYQFTNVELPKPEKK